MDTPLPLQVCLPAMLTTQLKLIAVQRSICTVQPTEEASRDGFWISVTQSQPLAVQLSREKDKPWQETQWSKESSLTTATLVEKLENFAY